MSVVGGGGGGTTEGHNRRPLSNRRPHLIEGHNRKPYEKATFNQKVITESHFQPVWVCPISLEEDLHSLRRPGSHTGSGIIPPPPARADIHLWKHYLPSTSFVGSKYRVVKVHHYDITPISFEFFTKRWYIIHQRKCQLKESFQSCVQRNLYLQNTKKMFIFKHFKFTTSSP